MLHLGYLVRQAPHIKFRHRPKRRWRAVVTGVLFIPLLLYGAYYFWPAKHMYAYAGENCVLRPTLLPGLQRLDASSGIHVSFANETTLGGYPLFARHVCVELTSLQAEQEPSFAVVPRYLPFARAITTLLLPNPPELKQTQLPELLSNRDPLTVELSAPDETYAYSLRSAMSHAACGVTSTTVRCDMPALGLQQGQSYELSLERSFAGMPTETLLTDTVSMVTPVTIVGGSAHGGAVIYDVPTELTVDFDKPLASAQGVTLKRDTGEPLAFTQQVRGNQLVLRLAAPLPRQANLVLHIDDVRATDRGYLNAPVDIAFRTSGGPRVIGRSIGAYAVSTSAVIRLTFDTAPKADALGQFVRLQASGGELPVQFRVAGNVVTIVPTRDFARCEAFTVAVADGLPNQYGVTGGSAYSFNSRSRCGATFSIGTSAEGRPITAHTFGSGGSTVLYVGATHGNERSSKYIMDAWVDHLESVAPSIPAHRRIVVIPAVNPDGWTRGSRTNARNVDLNRNFPANNWKQHVTLPGGRLVENGGGTAPLSEPESAALASYTQSVRPRLVLTYHSQASIVTANESGDSMALAIQYGRATGYRAVAESQLGGTFNYDTTGAYENWLHDKVGIPTLLVELPGDNGNYFGRNRAVMWSMANL